jgi:DNA-binding response OmpR family regulator
MESNYKKIVIVEDEPEAAEIYAEMMRISGYEVVKFFGGSTAVAEIADQKPSAVILDLMMPDVSGFDVLEYMKTEPNLSNIPVIIVSAKTLPADVDQGLQAGASVYLTKPVAYSELIRAIDEVLSGTDKGNN